MEVHETLEKFRAELDAIDTQVIEALARRFLKCRIIADYKRKNGISMMQPHRIRSVKQRTAKMGAERGLSPEFLDELYDLIIKEACRIEIDVMETEAEPREMSPVENKSSATQAAAAPGQSVLPARAASGDLAELGPVLVIGSSGNVGRLFAQMMVESGLCVRGLDRSPCGEGAGFLAGDVMAFTPEISRLIESSATIVVCLPEGPALAACSAIVERMRKGALWVDTLSVKSEICSCLSKESGKKIEAVSINPMFAPSCGFSGQNVAVVTVHPGSRSERFLAWLGSAGGIVTSLSAAEHDRATEAIQVITHTAILAFGSALKSLSYDVDAAWRLSTPVHRALMALLTRIVFANPGPYWDIQFKHPKGSSVRALLIESIAGLEKMARDGQASSFERSFLDLRQMFSTREPELRELCSKLLKSKRRNGGA